MIPPSWKRAVSLSALAAAALASQGCYTYSAFQGARVLDEGHFAVTPSASFVSFSNDGESEKVTTQFGAQGRAGLGNGLEFQGRYERLEFDGGSEDEGGDYSYGYNHLELGLKYSLLPDRVAIGMPVGFMYGEDMESSETWHVKPSLFVTAPMARVLDVNLSATALLFFEGDADNLLAFNGGLGIHPGDHKFTFMPEVGMLINPGEDGFFWHWGLGAAFEF